MRYAVRCCCMPVKVMGWLDLPKDCPDKLTIALFQSVPLNFWNLSPEEQVHHSPIQNLQAVIELKTYVHLSGSWERAVYSDDRPLSFWKRIPGFIPNQEWDDE